MSDYLVELSQNPVFKKAVQTLGLPIPMPQKLARSEGATQAQELTGKTILLGGAKAKWLADIIQGSGAVGGAGNDKVHALVYNATAATKVADLADMYEFFHKNIGRLAINGRVVVLAKSCSDTDKAQTAACAATATGFAKSVAKEIGKKGATATALYVTKGAEKHAEVPLTFFLSARSAFVDGQPVVVSKPTINKDKTLIGLKGKNVVVTGGARGIGEAVARRIAAEGAKVIVLDVPQAKEAADKLAAEIGGIGFGLDITADDAAKKIKDLAKEIGGIDVLINNAGVTRDKTLKNMSRDFWDLALNVNLAAAMTLTEAVLPMLNEGGRVICLSSIAGIAGNFGQTNYGAAKSGLIGYVAAQANAFAEKGATINAVAPGFIETQMTAAIPVTTREAGRRLSNLGQGGLPLDVAELITFLTQPGARGINGQTIRVCGGSLIGA